MFANRFTCLKVFCSVIPFHFARFARCEKKSISLRFKSNDPGQSQICFKVREGRGAITVRLCERARAGCDERASRFWSYSRSTASMRLTSLNPHKSISKLSNESRFRMIYKQCPFAINYGCHLTARASQTHTRALTHETSSPVASRIWCVIQTLCFGEKNRETPKNAN